MSAKTKKTKKRTFSIGRTKQLKMSLIELQDLAPVVRRPDNFIQRISHYPQFKMYFPLNDSQSFSLCIQSDLLRVCIFAVTLEK